MTDAWVRVPGRGDGSDDDPIRPDLDQYALDGWSGHQDADGTWTVHVYGPPDVVARVVADHDTAAPTEAMMRGHRVAIGSDRARNPRRDPPPGDEEVGP